MRAAQVRATRDTAGAEYHRESKLHSLGRSVLYLFQQPQPQRISAVASTDPPTGGDALPPPKAQTRERAPRGCCSLSRGSSQLEVVPTMTQRATGCETLSGGCRSSPTGGGRGASHRRMRRRWRGNRCPRTPDRERGPGCSGRTPGCRGSPPSCRREQCASAQARTHTNAGAHQNQSTQNQSTRMTVLPPGHCVAPRPARLKLGRTRAAPRLRNRMPGCDTRACPCVHGEPTSPRWHREGCASVGPDGTARVERETWHSCDPCTGPEPRAAGAQPCA